MQYWLMKSEPDVFGIDDLVNQPRKTEHWDGVRNYQARNMMRDEMKKGDLVFFYHFIQLMVTTQYILSFSGIQKATNLNAKMAVFFQVFCGH